MNVLGCEAASNWVYNEISEFMIVLCDPATISTGAAESPYSIFTSSKVIYDKKFANTSYHPLQSW